ncbi:MAG: cytochrome c biogenesis heme-transporting ATPase CcmA [Betaproteobacteria bacterium]|nr:cytochrome c biogenesis heme-transporting ATPase CcmA [Betaproteobacteria bacterium]
MLEAKGLACIRGERLLFHDLSFRVGPGSLLWISGGNGSGKTSLLRLLCGLSRPAAGAVLWLGADTSEECENFQRALIYQGHLNALKDDLAPEENLSFALHKASDRAAVSHCLREHGLGACLGLPVRVLSQGQKRRVALARLSLAGARPLWILDEPFAALDTAASVSLANLIVKHVRQQGTVLLTSHQEVEFADLPLQRLHLSGEPVVQRTGR